MSLWEKKKHYSTQYSHVVTDRSTDWAVTNLTSEIGRDPVLYGAYGRNIENRRYLYVLYPLLSDFNFFKHCTLGVAIHSTKSSCFFRGFGIKISFAL